MEPKPGCCQNVLWDHSLEKEALFHSGKTYQLKEGPVLPGTSAGGPEGEVGDQASELPGQQEHDGGGTARVGGSGES